MRRVLAGVVAAAVVLGAARVGAAPAERCPPVTEADVRAAAAAAVGWFERNQGPDGRWTYLVDEEGRDLGGYSAVRHAGVLLSLEQAARAGVPGAAEVADRGLRWALRELVPAGGGLALPESDGTVRTGGAALLARALLERRAAERGDVDGGVLVGLGRFLAGQVLDDGAVSALWRPGGGRDDDARDRFFTGEVLWALIGLADAFPDRGFEEPAAAVGRYLPVRDEAEDRFPPVSDHWGAYAYAELGERATSRQRAHAERLAGLVGVQVRVESTRWAGGLQQAIKQGPAVGSGLGTLGEAGAGLLVALGTDGAPGLAERVRCVAGMLVARQVAGGHEAVRGAWFTGGVSRMDDQQHALSALVLAGPALEAAGAGGIAGDAVGGGERRHPLAWVLAVPLLVANPFRRPRPGTVAVAAVAAAGVALLALSGPVLDLLDVSPASARVAAGGAVVVAALATVAAPGAAATVGATLGTLAVLALSVGADDGARALPGLVLAAVAAALVPDRWRHRGVAAAVAVASLLAGLDLAVDGVLGV